MSHRPRGWLRSTQLQWAEGLTRVSNELVADAREEQEGCQDAGAEVFLQKVCGEA